MIIDTTIGAVIQIEEINSVLADRGLKIHAFPDGRLSQPMATAQGYLSSDLMYVTDGEKMLGIEITFLTRKAHEKAALCVRATELRAMMDAFDAQATKPSLEKGIPFFKFKEPAE
jgi:hypothetical protein